MRKSFSSCVELNTNLESSELSLPYVNKNLSNSLVLNIDVFQFK